MLLYTVHMYTMYMYNDMYNVHVYVCVQAAATSTSINKQYLLLVFAYTQLLQRSAQAAAYILLHVCTTLLLGLVSARLQARNLVPRENVCGDPSGRRVLNRNIH